MVPQAFTLPAQAEGGRVRLVFDGIYKNARIWVNSYYLGMWPYGYSEICLDITDFACFGETENVVSVRVEREDLADSRWFTGCGIYRKVTVETAPSRLLRAPRRVLCHPQRVGRRGGGCCFRRGGKPHR